jgi:hypothetical protein
MMYAVTRLNRLFTLIFCVGALGVIAWGCIDLAGGELRQGAFVTFIGLFSFSAAIGRALDSIRTQRSHGPDLVIAMIGFLVIGTLSLATAVLSFDHLSPIGVIVGIVLDGFAALALFAWWTTRRQG